MVDNTLMSPMSLSELESNLNVLKEGPLNSEDGEFLRRFGDAVYNSKSKILGDLFERSARL
jgi:hypothetical protein